MRTVELTEAQARYIERHLENSCSVLADVLSSTKTDADAARAVTRLLKFRQTLLAVIRSSK